MRENWNEQIKGDLGRAGYGLITYRAIRVKRGNGPPGNVDEGLLYSSLRRMIL